MCFAKPRHSIHFKNYLCFNISFLIELHLFCQKKNEKCNTALSFIQAPNIISIMGVGSWLKEWVMDQTIHRWFTPFLVTQLFLKFLNIAKAFPFSSWVFFLILSNPYLTLTLTSQCPQFWRFHLQAGLFCYELLKFY